MAGSLKGCAGLEEGAPPREEEEEQEGQPGWPVSPGTGERGVSAPNSSFPVGTHSVLEVGGPRLCVALSSWRKVGPAWSPSPVQQQRRLLQLNDVFPSLSLLSFLLLVSLWA